MKLILLFISFFAIWVSRLSALEVMPEFIDQPGMIINPEGIVTEDDRFIMVK